MICGHDREYLKLGLEMCSFFGDDALGMAGDKQHPYAAAIRDGHDPAKLAAIVAELMRERGLSVVLVMPGMQRWKAPNHLSVRYNDTEIAVYDDGLMSRPLAESWTIPQARAFALALLDSPQATAQDIERMIEDVTS